MALAKARLSLLQSQGLLKRPETLEEKILKLEKQAKLTTQEETAVQASEVAAGDWGPVFVYGSMLSQQTWLALIDRIPEFEPCWLRGHERREVLNSPFAALVKSGWDGSDPDPDMLCVGMAVLELMPWERKLLDAVVDDGFELIEATIQPLDDLTKNILCTTYIWRIDRLPNALGKEDWSQFKFNCDHEDEFVVLCRDLLNCYKCSKISDEELKEKALKRRREQTGFEADEDEYIDPDAPPEEEVEEEVKEETVDPLAFQAVKFTQTKTTTRQYNVSNPLGT